MSEQRCRELHATVRGEKTKTFHVLLLLTDSNAPSPVYRCEGTGERDYPHRESTYRKTDYTMQCRTNGLLSVSQFRTFSTEHITLRDCP